MRMRPVALLALLLLLLPSAVAAAPGDDLQSRVLRSRDRVFPALASRAPRLTKADGQIDWTRPAAAIKNHVRAMEPWPKTYTFWHRPGAPPLRLIVGPIEVADRADDLPPPGTVVEAAGDRLVLATGEGLAVLTSLQPAGKRAMAIGEFLLGYRVQPGERFGPEAEEPGEG